MEGSLIDNLKVFGLSDTESKIYLLLTQIGWSTALNLSKKTKINRSTLYRVMDSLESKGLIQIQYDDKTTLYNVTAVEMLKLKIEEQKQKTVEIENSFKFLYSSLSILKNKKSSSTSVRVLKGIKGLHHMEYVKANQTNKNLYTFESSKWSDVLGEKFTEEIRSLYVTNNIKVFELSNKVEKRKRGQKVSWTKNQQFIDYHHHQREVSQTTIALTDDIYVVGNIIHFYEFDENDFVGIEIVNTDLATMYKSIFEYFWNHAKVVDDFGGENL